MSRCRIVTTWKCNLDCEYCCNNIPAIKDSFKYVESIPQEFDEYAITGGEPLINWLKLIRVLSQIPADKIVHLYTNGILLDEIEAISLKLAGVNGINVGYHINNPPDLNILAEVHKILPVRIICIREELTSDLMNWCVENRVFLRISELNDCDPPDDARFCLEK